MLLNSPKAIPWFVSDVTPPDFTSTIQILQHADEWATSTEHGGGQTEDSVALQTIAKRFQERVDSGVFELSVPLSTKLGKFLS